MRLVISLAETIEQLGVGTQYIKRTNKANTALAFVSLQDDGQRFLILS